MIFLELVSDRKFQIETFKQVYLVIELVTNGL